MLSGARIPSYLAALAMAAALPAPPPTPPGQHRPGCAHDRCTYPGCNGIPPSCACPGRPCSCGIDVGPEYP